MSQSAAVQAPATGHTIRRAVWALVLAIVVMAATCFVHLIDEPQALPYWLVPLPILAGGLGGAAVLRDERLDHRRRQNWAVGLAFTGLLAVAVALLMVYYVLPF